MKILSSTLSFTLIILGLSAQGSETPSSVEITSTETSAETSADTQQLSEPTTEPAIAQPSTTLIKEDIRQQFRRQLADAKNAEKVAAEQGEVLKQDESKLHMQRGVLKKQTEENREALSALRLSILEKFGTPCDKLLDTVAFLKKLALFDPDMKELRVNFLLLYSDEESYMRERSKLLSILEEAFIALNQEYAGIEITFNTSPDSTARQSCKNGSHEESILFVKLPSHEVALRYSIIGKDLRNKKPTPDQKNIYVYPMFAETADTPILGQVEIIRRAAELSSSKNPGNLGAVAVHLHTTRGGDQKDQRQCQKEWVKWCVRNTFAPAASEQEKVPSLAYCRQSGLVTLKSSSTTSYSSDSQYRALKKSASMDADGFLAAMLAAAIDSGEQNFPLFEKLLFSTEE